MKQAKTISLNKLVQSIKTAKKILIVTHEGPDGDGIGSILALGEGLKQMGKQVKLYMADPVPQMYQYLPGHKQIKGTLKNTEKFDLSFIVDLGEIERGGKTFLEHPHRGVTMSLDHHANGTHNADYNFCLPKQASSGEVIFKILKALKVKFTSSIATNIYTAMVTDTGSFKYSNTTPETFAIASELSKQKIDYWEVALNCFETYSLPRMELLKRVIAGMQIHKNKKVAWIEFKQEDFKKTGALSEDTEGFINYPRCIEGVEVAIAYKEIAKNTYKISMRSKNYLDVGAIAATFDGGGHTRASGCKLKGTYAQVQKQLMQKILPRLK